MTEYPFDTAAAVPPAVIAAAWERELPGVPVSSISVITPLWRVAKTLADDRRRTLRRIGIDPATLDLLSTLRRSGTPWSLTTRELAAQTLVTAGAISQRVARAERDGLVARSSSDAGRRAVAVNLTDAGHELVERAVRELLTHEEELMAGLSAEDHQLLSGLLGRLTTTVRRKISDG
ncbi:DNA-binding MarR family transcriptional regulator [Promicromonospora sp. AC04]|uniref:MarR family winged helix-turn-helix transcriptional regulator n=1 Tax=Promicromonospora sp. AC04 TaxID=2135723 RepID=UPI000D3547A5|nr:MarR family transcriptional regulator [Promicromonospora sp. AC04]PUB22266.1 DNA-binding MarR family transcriptional regulator [Promicromonospora sp. AC04]